MKASNEFPQPSPSFSYSDGPARGSTEPPMDLRTMLAATAEAAYL